MRPWSDLIIDSGDVMSPSASKDVTQPRPGYVSSVKLSKFSSCIFKICSNLISLFIWFYFL